MLQPNRTNPRFRSEPARPLGSRLAGTGETVPRGASIRLVLVVFGCAALVRASVLFGIQRSGLNSELIGDAALFDRWARSIAEGDWIGEGVFYQAPLYPYFMGIIYTVFGADALGVRIAQCLLGALSAVFVAVAAARMFSRRVAWVAGISLALYAPAIWMDGAIQKASVGFLLSSAILFLAVPREDRIRWSRGAALGFLTGLLILTRENAALLLPILLSWVWCGWVDSASVGARRSSPAFSWARPPPLRW